MGRKLLLMLLATLVIVAALPGAAFADDDDDDRDDGDLDDRDAIYLSLGDSLAMGSLADSTGETIFPSNKSYTDHLYRILQRRVDDDIEHVKLGCDGYKTSDMITDPGDGKCNYAEGTQLEEAKKWLATGDVVLVTIDIGANDVNSAAIGCGFAADCVLASIPPIMGRLGFILSELRSVYNGPIVALTYFNPNVTASIGFVSGSPQGPPGPGFAVATTELAAVFNFGLPALLLPGLIDIYGAYGVLVADVFSAWATADFGDDGGRYQIAGNGIPDNADVVCLLTYMCPEGAGVDANQHPTSRGYKTIAREFWKIVRTLALDVDGDDDDD